MVVSARLSISDRFDQRLFDAIYSRSLVYNACWEDPAVDRQALRFQADDRVLVITSAGCNALDYALAGPARIHAVDANPRQTALIELKIAGIRRLDFDDFFALFGGGRHPGFADLYRSRLRLELSPFAQRYWDRHGDWFAAGGRHGGLYYRGLSGRVARGFGAYVAQRPRLRDGIEALLECRDLDRQREVYEASVAPELWTRPVDWALSRQLTMSLLGVPHPQRKEVQRQHAGGVAGFVREAIGFVASRLPFWTNYFWALYLRGHYTAANCPEYLRPANFALLKAGLVDRISLHTTTVTRFLQTTDERISKFVLLDHMDWMSSYRPQALAEEWDAILARATGGARAIFRSAHADPAYLQAIRVRAGGASTPLVERLRFHPDLADRLQRQDRVHTYAGFHIADLPA